MKKIIFISSVLLLAACSKGKAPAPFLSDECQDTIKFSTQIMPMITDNCSSCHGVGNGQSPTLSDHASIMANAELMLKAMKGEGAPLMPDGGPALHDSLIQQFSCWIGQGKLNN